MNDKLEVIENQKINELYQYLLPEDVVNQGVYKYNNTPVRIKGTCFRKNNQWYIGQNAFNIQIVDFQPNGIKSGDVIVVYGILHCKEYPQHGGLYIRIKVRNVEIQTRENIRENNNLNNLVEFETEEDIEFNQKIKIKSYKDPISYINKVLSEKNNIGIGVIHGKGAQTQVDFKSALLNTIDKYSFCVNIYSFEISLNNDKELANLLYDLRYNNNIDFVIIVRGGGTKTDLISVGGVRTGIAICEIADRFPVYIALGHSLDSGNKYIEISTDYSFLTPSHAGAQIGSIIKMYCEQKEILRNTMEITKKNSLLEKELMFLKYKGENKAESKKYSSDNFRSEQKDQNENIYKYTPFLLVFIGVISIFLLILNILKK